MSSASHTLFIFMCVYLLVKLVAGWLRYPMGGSSCSAAPNVPISTH